MPCPCTANSVAAGECRGTIGRNEFRATLYRLEQIAERIKALKNNRRLNFRELSERLTVEFSSATPALRRVAIQQHRGHSSQVTEFRAAIRRIERHVKEVVARLDEMLVRGVLENRL